MINLLETFYETISPQCDFEYFKSIMGRFIEQSNLVEGWKPIDDKCKDGGWYIFKAKGYTACVSAYNKGWDKPRHWDYSVPPTHYMKITEIKE